MHNDPIEGYIDDPMSSVQLELTRPPTNHQTLVVVNICAESTPNYIERAKRFVYSLNTPKTMKADIVTVSDGKLYYGLVITGSTPGGLSVESSHHVQIIEVNQNEKH